jgi:hypothetical protein
MRKPRPVSTGRAFSGGNHMTLYEKNCELNLDLSL